MAAGKTTWERAAREAGLGDRLVAEPACPECDGTGEFTWRRAHSCLSDRTTGCPECNGSGCSEAIRCPASGETWGRGEMAWMRDGLDTVVSVASKLGCEVCGERPKLPGEDVCGDCLPRTLRNAELSAALEAAQ